MHQKKFCVSVAFISLVVCVGCIGPAERSATVAVSASTQRAAASAEVENLAPIELARRFWIAYLEQDAESLKRYSQPNPDLHLLWDRAVAFSPHELEMIKPTVRSCPGRILNSGEKFIALDRPLEMQTYDPTIFCPVYLEWPIEPLFLPCVRKREGDGWRVDAGGWIAALKASARVKAERAAATHPVVPR